MRVDTMKPKLKPPGTERLKLRYDSLLSNSAFKFNLRRYTEGGRLDALRWARGHGKALQVESIKTRVEATI